MKRLFKISASILVLISVAFTFTSCKFWRYFQIEELESELEYGGWDNCFTSEAFEFCTVGEFVIQTHFNNMNEENTHNLHVGVLSQNKNSGVAIKKITLYDGDEICFEKEENLDLVWYEMSYDTIDYKYRAELKEQIYIPEESIKMNMDQRYILKVLVEVDNESEPFVKEISYTFVVRKYAPVWMQ